MCNGMYAPPLPNGPLAEQTQTLLPLYTVRNFWDDNKKSYWIQIGSAWEHADWKGYSVQLEGFSVNGRLTLRVFEEKPENDP